MRIRIEKEYEREQRLQAAIKIELINVEKDTLAYAEQTSDKRKGKYDLRWQLRCGRDVRGEPRTCKRYNAI